MTRVRFVDQNLETEVEPGTSILDAARQAHAPEGDACGGSADCAPGFHCLAAVCKRLCEDEGDCTEPGGICRIGISCGGAPTGASACTVNCDPAATGGCGAGSSCQVAASGALVYTDCSYSGSNGQDVTCGGNSGSSEPPSFLAPSGLAPPPGLRTTPFSRASILSCISPG